MPNLLLNMLKDAGVVERKLVTLKNAGDSDIYLNIKKAYGNHELLGYLATHMWHLINKSNPTCLAASGYGGIPLATAMSVKYHWDLAMIRDEIRQHGLPSIIDGYLPASDDRVAIIDDVITTGTSLANMVFAIKQTGAMITGCYAVAKRNDVKLNCHVKALFSLEDFL